MERAPRVRGPAALMTKRWSINIVPDMTKMSEVTSRKAHGLWTAPLRLDT